jgi:hypothetical protein
MATATTLFVSLLRDGWRSHRVYKLLRSQKQPRPQSLRASPLKRGTSTNKYPKSKEGWHSQSFFCVPFKGKCHCHYFVRVPFKGRMATATTLFVSLLRDGWRSHRVYKLLRSQKQPRPQSLRASPLKRGTSLISCPF